MSQKLTRSNTSSSFASSYSQGLKRVNGLSTASAPGSGSVPPSTEPLDISDDKLEKPKNDPENELEELKLTWRSLLYGFFKSNILIQYHDGRLCHFFQCAAQKCKSPLKGIHCFQDSKDKSSTANLKHHAIKCFGKDAVNNAMKVIKGATPSSSIFTIFACQGQQQFKYSHPTHSNAEVHTHLVKWITESNHPIRIMDDWELLWTVHIEYQGQMLAFLLNIIEVPETYQSHSGANLAVAFQGMLEGFGLEQKIFAFNTDNTSCNDTQSAKLANLDNSFSDDNHIRCFNHTLQLSTQALLKPFNKSIFFASNNLEENAELAPADEYPAAEEDEDDFLCLDTTHDAASDNDVDDNANEELEADELDAKEQERLLEETSVVRDTIAKIRKLSFSIIHSTTIALPGWHQACAEHNLASNLIPRDIATRWNSTYDMLSFVFRYRQVVDAVTADKTLKLRKFELDDNEWEIVGDLVSVLEKYKKAMLFFLKDSASIAAIILAMDKLDAGLQVNAKQKIHPGIKAAMKFAKAKLNRYYSLTDLSPCYCIAMVLHPSLKLEYFHVQEWEQEWIETALSLTHNAYLMEYEGKGELAGTDYKSEDDDKAEDTNFTDISLGKRVACRSEIDEYLAQPVEDVKDALDWWFRHHHAFPTLSRMARDYLSIPATSTAVERVFLCGRHLLHFTHNRLSVSSLQAHLCLGSWGLHDMYRAEEILGVVGSKKRKLIVSDDDEKKEVDTSSSK